MQSLVCGTTAVDACSAKDFEDYLLSHCHTIQNYFERHQIFEIINELMIHITIDQPGNVVEYLVNNLSDIAEKFVRAITHLEFHNSFS